MAATDEQETCPMRATLPRLIAPLFLGASLLAFAGGSAGNPPIPTLPPPTAPATSAQPGDLGLTYAIYVGGVHVIDAGAHIGPLADMYRVGLALQTDGFLGRIANWKTDVRAFGRLGAALPQPVRFTAHGAWRDEPRLTTLDYPAGGAPLLSLADPAPEKDREPVPKDLRQGTLDPVSAIVAVLDRVGRGGTCELTVPVYDGRQRYDLAFTDQGQDQVAASDLSVFSGPARRCSVAYKPLAGKWKENRPDRRDRDGEGARRAGREVTLWIAPATPGGPAVPVRLEMDSPLGPVMVHLAKLERVG
jgi:hypothetical protein